MVDLASLQGFLTFYLPSENVSHPLENSLPFCMLLEERTTGGNIDTE
jgi:hypothetical protein